VCGLRATGADIDADQIRLAELAAANVEGVRFLVSDARHLPFDNGEFDIVSTNKTTRMGALSEWEHRL
jgi:ubiquinone/menaquinone biosynthesis C-methylase UbiE